MAFHVKKGPKIVLAAVGIGAFLFALKSPFIQSHLQHFKSAIAVSRISMPKIADAQLKNVKPIPYPGSDEARVPAPLFRGWIWEWNAQAGMLYAVGGKTTTRGSLMEKYGVNLLLERQDDTDKMAQALVACASELKGGAKQCSTGANFVVIMGGGVPQFVAKTNINLKKLGPGWQLKVIGAVGRSNGEDGCWAPPSFKANPHSLASTEMYDASGTLQEQHGMLLSAVIRDDDWNVCQKFFGDNGIKSNPDEKTFDPDTVNWVNSSDYNVAAADFVASKCENRMLVHDGKPTGKQVHVCINGTATWTPGDYVAATKRGGVSRFASSKEYLMPATIVGIGKFFSDNPDETKNFLKAIFEGGDQVRAFPAALHKASAIAAEVYADQGDTGYSNGDYWFKYFGGIHQNDKLGNPVDLGGSAVYGLEDNLNLFGVNRGSNDDFRSLYGIYSGVDLTQYPELYKDTPIPDVADVESKTYLVINQAEGVEGAPAAATVDYAQQDTQGSQVGDQSYQINFATGSDQPLPDGIEKLKLLKDSMAITRLFIAVTGHTDDVGLEAQNLDLSRRRAQAVVNFLHNSAPSSFPMSRFRADGKGSSQPAASNATPQGRAINRRVEIVLRGGK